MRFWRRPGLTRSVRSTAAALLIALLMLLGMAGCGPRHPAATYPVSGKVVFADGTPLASGGVVLCESVAAEGQPAFNARGAIQSDGTFRLSTFGEGDGAVAGKHRVLVRAKRDAADYLEKGVIPRPVVDPQSERYETSGLEFTVEQGNNQFTLVVKRPSKDRTLTPMPGLKPR